MFVNFVKRKWGRVDDKKQWKNIKKLWLDSYFNKKEIKELSILKKSSNRDFFSVEISAFDLAPSA